jgi:Zn-dependent alcohol dehydrogenase
VVAIGVGGVGLSVLMGAKLRGAIELVAVDVDPRKLARARELGLATHTVDASKDDVAEAVREITGGAGADASFDAAGAAGTLEAAIEVVRPGGRVVAIGVLDSHRKVALDPSLLMRERWLTGTFGGSIVPRHHIPRFVDLYMAGRLDLAALMQPHYPLEGIGEALDDLDAGRITRGVIRFPDSPDTPGAGRR